MTWDDIGVPARLRELADETWQALDASPGDDSAEDQETCDQLRTAYAEQYAEAEAFAHSTVLAQRRTAAAEARREVATERRAATGCPTPYEPWCRPQPARSCARRWVARATQGTD